MIVFEPHSPISQAFWSGIDRYDEIKKLKEIRFKNPLYFFFDMDAIDPAFAPGVSHHEAGGLTSRQVINFINKIDVPIIGTDIVELNPKRDNGITAA